MINAYPLTWPRDWPRTTNRESARFNKRERQYSSSGGGSWMRNRALTVSDGVERVIEAVTKLGVDRQDVIVSTNVRTRLDGLPRSGEPEPKDPGAAVYWQESNGAPRVIAIDQYDRVADNLAAIAGTLESMRSIARWGGARILERAFTGFTALPSPNQVSISWRTVLGVPNGERDISVVERHYRQTRAKHHPDRGGDVALFNAVQCALEQAQQELGS